MADETTGSPFASNPHNYRPAAPFRGLPHRSAGWYTFRCRYEYRSQSDESHHGYAPCWLVCLNPKVPQQSEPTFEGSPSAGGTVSSRSRPSYSADHQTAHRSFRCKGAHLAVEGR
jgi:hypothetical protein